MNKDQRILIKTTAMLSFTGVVVDNNLTMNNMDCIVLKTSDKTNIMMIIPKDEITKYYSMSD